MQTVRPVSASKRWRQRWKARSEAPSVSAAPIWRNSRAVVRPQTSSNSINLLHCACSARRIHAPRSLKGFKNPTDHLAYASDIMCVADARQKKYLDNARDGAIPWTLQMPRRSLPLKREEGIRHG